MILTDSHAHLVDKPLCDDPDLVPALVSKGVARIVAQSAKVEDFERNERLHESHPDAVIPAFGIHPFYVDEFNKDSLALLKETLERHPQSPVGEIGLDFFKEYSRNAPRQIMAFEAQLRLAAQLKRPVILHLRKSAQAAIPILNSIELPANGVVHGYSGSFEEISPYLKKGFYVGVGSVLLNSAEPRKFIEALKRIPLDRMVLETDSPHMSHDGNGSPLRVFEVLKKLSEILSIDEEELAKITEENVNRLFFPT